jgi:hypothetical protein
MKKITRNWRDGHYHVHGRTYRKLIGSRAEVMHKTAFKTKAGLTIRNLKYNKQGKIVSRNKSMTAKRDKRLWKLGYRFEKGKFGVKKVQV